VTSLILLQFILLIISQGMDCMQGMDCTDATTAGVQAANSSQISFSSQKSIEHAETTWGMELLECERIQLPGGGLITGAGGVSLHSSEDLAVYSRGMPVKGRIQASYADPHAITPLGSSLCIAPLNLSAFLAGIQDKVPQSGQEICTETLDWNGTGIDRSEKRADQSFSIPEDKIAGKRSGLYAAYALDKNRSLMAPVQPFFLTEGKAVLQAEELVLSENQSIVINLSTGKEDGRRKLFVAAIMPRREYENATIKLVENKSNPRSILLSFGSRSAEIVVDPATLPGQMMDLISLLPENSAISMQDSTQSAVELILLGDGPWEKGEYVINCAIYSSGVGVWGLKQKIVKII